MDQIVIAFLMGLVMGWNKDKIMDYMDKQKSKPKKVNVEVIKK